MNDRSIGSDAIGEIGLGCMGMTHTYGWADADDCFDVLRKSLELGCNHWDTADLYGHGQNEALLAGILKKHREKVFISTKFGNVFDRSLTIHQDRVKANARRIVDGSAAYLGKAIDASLKRLAIDYIDLYYLHRVDPLIPIEETVGAMAELVRDGKIRYIGLSEASLSTLSRANAVHPIAAIQSEYSLFTRNVEKEILPYCQKHGIALVAFSPLGRGLLTGQIGELDGLAKDDWRQKCPRFQGDNFKVNTEKIRPLADLARQRGATPAQLAIAWLLAKASNIIPIPGTKRVKYLLENVAAADIVLNEKEKQLLNGIGEATGARCHADAADFLGI